jgi:hypothetical protein
MLRTTINVHLSILSKISAASNRLNISRRELVVRLLMRIMRDIGRHQGDFTLVKYQPRDPGRRWKCFPVVFQKHQNEFFTDLKRFSRFSVSHLVAIAVREYLPELLAEETDERYNYTCCEWALGQRMVEGAFCWEIFWGKPACATRQTTGVTILRRTGPGGKPQWPPAGPRRH